MPMKLSYFDVRGLAETSRFILAIAEQEYEDFRYPLEVIDMSKHEMKKEEFDKQSGKLLKSLNKVPVLDVDGVTIPQSKSIERFLARRFNMMGQTDVESAQIDAICESVRDFKDMYQKVRSLPSEERDDGMNEWFTKTLVERLTLLEHQIVGEAGFSVGNSLSLADVVLFTFITEFFDNKEASYNATLVAPKIRAIINSVGENEKVKHWITSRPKTDF